MSGKNKRYKWVKGTRRWPLKLGKIIGGGGIGCQLHVVAVVDSEQRVEKPGSGPTQWGDQYLKLDKM